MSKKILMLPLLLSLVTPSIVSASSSPNTDVKITNKLVDITVDNEKVQSVIARAKQIAKEEKATVKAKRGIAEEEQTVDYALIDGDLTYFYEENSKGDNSCTRENIRKVFQRSS